MITEILVLLGRGCCDHGCQDPGPEECTWDSGHLWGLFLQVKNKIALISKLDTSIDVMVATVFKMRLTVQRAYDMVGSPGPPGDEGDPGEKGDKGPTGDPGHCPEMTCLVGPAGPPGRTGEIGEPGPKGECCYGARGHRGRKGEAGRGSPGVSGLAGHKGSKGDSGRVIWGGHDLPISPW